MSKPLRICLILQGSFGHVGGLEYTTNIILALGSLPSEVRSKLEICLFGDVSFIEPSLYSRIEPYISNVYNPAIHLERPTIQNRLRWKISSFVFKKQYPMYDTFFKKESIDFVYPYFSLTKSSSYRSAALIYDFQHKYLPEFFTQDEIEKRDKLCSSIASNASAIVLSSKDAESDFHKFFPEGNLKTKVLSFHTRPSPEWYEANPIKTQKEYHLPERFFLLSNQFWQHKNHCLVFEALKILQEQSIFPNIVFTGGIFDYRQPDYSNKILQIIHKFGIAKQVYLLGLIPKFDQIQIMRLSLAVIQPSLFEGWSTLVENAKCLGKSIILSDLPVHKEQNPPNSIFFERNSPNHLASLLAKYWEDSSPTPNLEQEKIARKNNLNEIQNFGYRFLEIAQAY
ncbi:MAG: glycosyltransferase [Aulosira sp. DedQUE10]|nr:glycosyltransferase [Aulosira sp. DedQUE10]